MRGIAHDRAKRIAVAPRCANISVTLTSSGRIGQYEILERIAVGGMAEIYLAKQASVGGFERKVVLKRVLPELAMDPQFVEAFLEEARLAARLGHPNIVQVIELAQTGNTYFIALELIDGLDAATLLAFCRAQGILLPVPVALRIACDMLLGLDFAHSLADEHGAPLGLIHRDVSPSNLLVAFNGVSKVVDFGIAKATAKGESRTKSGVIKGKLAYFAPEQILSAEKVDKRIDVFAAGIVLYELLTAVHPFRSDSELDTLQAILHATPPKFDEVRAGSVPEAWQEVIARALAKDRNERYPSCAAFLEAIEQTAARAALRLSPHEVRDFLAMHRKDIDALIASRRAASSRGGFTEPVATPSTPADVERKTRELVVREPAATTPVDLPLTKAEPPPAPPERPIAVLFIAAAVALLCVMWIVGASLDDPEPSFDAQRSTEATSVPVRHFERSALGQRNRSAMQADSFALEATAFDAGSLAALEAQGLSLRASSPGICVRHDAAAPVSQQLVAVLRVGATYTLTFQLTRAPARIGIETERGRVAEKTASAVGEVRLELPQGTLERGLHELRIVLDGRPGDKTATTLRWLVLVAGGEHVGSRMSDEDGDCATVGDGDCDDRDEAVSNFARERCGNGTDDDCDGVIDCSSTPQAASLPSTPR